MDQALNIDTEQFQQMLAEALRAGPVSPLWRQAVDTLKAAGESGEELALLCKARERLEGGRAYRSIRAGNGFTRKLMARLDETDQMTGRGVSSASFITAMAVLVILSVVGGLAWMLFSPVQDNEGKVDLRSVYFVTTALSEDFDQKIGDGWQAVGSIPLVAQKGLRLQLPRPFTQEIAGGGLLCPLELSPRVPVTIETTIEGASNKSRVLAEVFVTDTPTFSSDRGVSDRELKCQIDASGSRVGLPDGRGVVAASHPAGPTVNKPITIRIRLSRDKCIIEQDGVVVWSGEHQLLQDRPRRFGVRLLAQRNANSADVAIRSIRLMKP